MKVRNLIEKLDLKCLTGDVGLEREVKGVYVNDLLSWVMSHGNSGDIWVTVQIHPNIIAVAVLAELACIVVPENIQVESVTLEKAIEENIPILAADNDAYTLCCEFKELGI